MTATAHPLPPAAEAVMAQAPSENFPVASRVLPRRERAHLLAVYGFARLVDDIGDEGDPAQRPALLDWLDGELDRVYSDGEPTHALMRRLVPTVRACAIPRDPLQRLVAANRLDQTKSSYATFDELLDYCRLSAAPVGELVLRVFGVASDERIALSDRVCAGLQVVEHMQDVAEDRERGRVYLPREDLARAGGTQADLQPGPPSAAFQAAMAIEAARSRELLAAGAPLARTLPPRMRLAVTAFVAGGRAALDALEGAGYDVLGAARPRPARRAFAAQWVRGLIDSLR